MMRSSALRRIAHGGDGAALRVVEPLALEHLHHAEHAVHRRADLVAHGGEEGRLRLVGGFGLGALALGGLARIVMLLFAFPQHRDVAVDAEQAAVGERLVGELDVAAAARLALVAVAARRAHHDGARLHRGLDVLGGAEVAALRLIADDVVAGGAGPRDLGRHVEKPVEVLVAEHPVEVLVDQDDAVVHVFEDRAHDLARRLDLDARRVEFLLAQLRLGDVAGRADHAQRLPAGVALHDAALPRPAPASVAGFVAVFAHEARRRALEVIHQRLPVLRQIVRMHPLGRLLRRQHLVLRHSPDRAQRRGVVDRVADDIPVVDAVIDGFERERVALLVGLRRACGRARSRFCAARRPGCALALAA